MAWFLNSIDAHAANASGPMNGPARATTIARTAAHGICRRSTART
ncbi:MAG: hypothetical protein QOJ42_5976 [Acidobacteriaceae bacterium]|jgi:hypothetical protein|nr:hypothetical protein [Acidobacteriaceae bacterium]